MATADPDPPRPESARRGPGRCTGGHARPGGPSGRARRRHRAIGHVQHPAPIITRVAGRAGPHICHRLGDRRDAPRSRPRLPRRSTVSRLQPGAPDRPLASHQCRHSRARQYRTGPDRGRRHRRLSSTAGTSRRPKVAQSGRHRRTRPAADAPPRWAGRRPRRHASSSWPPSRAWPAGTTSRPPPGRARRTTGGLNCPVADRWVALVTSWLAADLPSAWRAPRAPTANSSPPCIPPVLSLSCPPSTETGAGRPS